MLKKRTPVKEMHKELNILLLHHRCQYHLGQLCHKNIYFEGYESLPKFYSLKENSTRLTRQRNTVHLKVRSRTVMGGKAIAIRGPNFWIGLSNELKVFDKIKPFSRALRTDETGP